MESEFRQRYRPCPAGFRPAGLLGKRASAVRIRIRMQPSSLQCRLATQTVPVPQDPEGAKAHGAPRCCWSSSKAWSHGRLLTSLG